MQKGGTFLHPKKRASCLFIPVSWIISKGIIKLPTTGYNIQENLLPFNLDSPSLPQSRLAWVPPSTQLHSCLAPSTHLCNNLLGRRPVSSQTFLHGRRSSVFLGATGTDMTTNPIAKSNPINSQAVSCVILPSRLCFLFVCLSVATHWRVEMWRGGSPSLSVEWSVSMASVDYNKHRVKCLTYHDVCGMMGDHIQSSCCYMIIQVCSIWLYINILKASSILVDGFHDAAFY